jgi:hypothetical protein
VADSGFSVRGEPGGAAVLSGLLPSSRQRPSSTSIRPHA